MPAMLQAQTLRHPLTVDYVGLSAYSSGQADVFGFANNQAALAKLHQLSAGVYGERKFLLSATSLYAGVVAIPTSRGNFGVNFKYSGFQNFNEKQAGVAYAKGLGEQLDVGIQFNYYGYQVPSYANNHTANVEVGAMLHLGKKLNVGVHVFNPVGGNLTKAEEKISSAYKLGVGYDPSEQVFLAAEIVRQEGCPIYVNAGLQYQYEKQFVVRLGIATLSSSGYVGAGIRWKKLRLDLTIGYHSQLGISPGLLLMTDVGNK